MRPSPALIKKAVAILVAIAAAYVAYDRSIPGGASVPSSIPSSIPSSRPSTESTDTQLARAFDEKRTAFQVSGAGTVARVLPDDRDGSRHQRFILSLTSGQSLMVAHNIDLAPRISSLKAGDTVSFYGEYEWNPRGGVIHWTHHDPQGRHVAGWLEHEGRRYQ